MKKIKDPNIFLDHILESIVEIKKNTNNLTKNKFIKSVPIQDAVIRRLEIIGEATKNLPSLLKNKNANNKGILAAARKTSFELSIFFVNLKKNILIVKDNMLSIIENHMPNNIKPLTFSTLLI